MILTESHELRECENPSGAMTERLGPITPDLSSTTEGEPGVQDQNEKGKGVVVDGERWCPLTAC